VFGFPNVNGHCTVLSFCFFVSAHYGLFFDADALYKLTFYIYLLTYLLLCADVVLGLGPWCLKDKTGVLGPRLGLEILVLGLSLER